MKTATVKARAPAVGMNGHAAGGFSVFVNDVQLHVPGWVQDIDAFRRWIETDEFPEQGNVWWLQGGVWADMSKEQVFWHVDVKGAIFAVLYFLVKSGKLGRVLSDGVLLTNYEADISGNPDGMFLSRETLNSGRIQLVEGARGGSTEVQGTPDMVLEVVSDSSVKKDLVTLLEAYFKAGIAEYWVVDARKDQLRFEIFRSTSQGYKPMPKKHGWVKSTVFGKSFRLVVEMDESGDPEYTLEVR